MTELDRRDKLQQVADTLLEKVDTWVRDLDLDSQGTQPVRHLCATLKDLKELCQDLEEPEEKGITVRIEGGEEAWNG